MEAYGEQRRVLLIDDDPVFCYFMAHLAAMKAMRLDCMASVLELEDEHPAFRYNAAIVDFHLGQVNGFDSCDVLSVLSASDMPIILISSSDQQELPMKPWPGSIQSFICKREGPFAILDLAEKLALEYKPAQALLPSRRTFVEGTPAGRRGEAHWVGM